MGNRCGILLKEVSDKITPDTPVIYLHWNGGLASVKAFIRAGKYFGVRCGQYGSARLVQIIGNWFGGTLSLGIQSYGNIKNWNEDNGLYVVENWNIINQHNKPSCGNEIDLKKTKEILKNLIKINRQFFNKNEAR